jgi:molecular chaperone DnaK
MMKDAEAHADEDRRKREEVEARNQADNVVYQSEKSMKEHGDKLDESDRQHVESALAAAKEALNGQDIDRIKQTSEELLTASQKFAEVLYKQAQQDQAGAPGASDPASEANDDVVDAEVVDDGEERSA